MIDPRADAASAALAAALEAAQQQRLYLIARLQIRQDWGALAQNGRIERISSAHASGLAVHVFTNDGHVGFASSDLLEPREAADLVRRASELAAAARSAGALPTRALERLESEPLGEWPCQAWTLADSPRDTCQAALLEAHRTAAEVAGGFATASSLSLTEDWWRIARSDGADICFRLPRALARHSFTARGANGSASASASVAGADARVILDAATCQTLHARARHAVRRARDAREAPPLASGSFRLILDHTLAKGLAHEAFGHAAESDVAPGSILATNGRLRLGERVGPSNVSIVDGPLEGDYAWQPVSANGLRRQTVSIIEHGVLRSGLSDPFSAESAGLPLTGACRASSFRSRPMPRMSNIRLLVEGTAPLPADAETLEPAELRDALDAAGLLSADEPTLLLAGHRGGQVTPGLGDFVFSCAAVYDLSDGVAARRPTLFSGKCLSALGAVVGAAGGLLLDTPGHCVKGSQGVPTSGGSHAFVLLERHPEVRVGA